MSYLLIKLEECPECKKKGIIFGHFGVSKTDPGWIGVKCLECGWTKKDEELTAKLQSSVEKVKKFFSGFGKEL